MNALLFVCQPRLPLDVNITWIYEPRKESVSTSMGHTNPYPLEPPFELRSPGHNSSPSSSPAWPSSPSESSDDAPNWFDSPSTVHPFSASTKSTKRPRRGEPLKASRTNWSHHLMTH